MKWEDLLTTRRTGQPVDKIRHDRTEFERDYDRLVFSPPFRRLQNKTQVFPLPEANIFVHNRLTHSLEVSCVGRSLGNKMASRALNNNLLRADYAGEIGSIVATACLAHDLGNPPFGHNGEKAIQYFFSKYLNTIDASSLTPAQRYDLLNFDGNANTFRLLTHKFNGRRDGGFALTLPSVASVVKYPRSSVGVKKFGFFDQDSEAFEMVRETFRLREVAPGVYQRYPLVYLVEAADDICYQIMDVEDATRLGILTFEQTFDLLSAFMTREDDKWFFDNLDSVFRQVQDTHERVSYLRSIVIGKLVGLCSDIFWDNREAIIEGDFKGGLTDHLPAPQSEAIKQVAKLAVNQIYHHKSVVEIELSGLEILNTLLHRFVTALMEPETYQSQLISAYISPQFQPQPNASLYDRLIAAVDIVTGMTDTYALDLYKKMGGVI